MTTKSASITLAKHSVDIIPTNAHGNRQYVFSSSPDFLFSHYHNTNANIATSTGSVKDILDDAIAIGREPLLRLPVA